MNIQDWIANFTDNAKIRFKLNSCLGLVKYTMKLESELEGTQERLKMAFDEISELKKNSRMIVQPKKVASRKQQSVAMLDHKTGEVLKIYQTMAQACRSHKIREGTMWEYFKLGLDQCGGYKWKKIAKVRKCKVCLEFKAENRQNFRKRGIKNDIQYYSTTCKTCQE